MDFVVVGFGLGALGVLLGMVMLGWRAPRAERAAARASSPDGAVRLRASAAAHRGTGQSFIYAGGALFLATVAGLMGSLDDRTGAFLVTTTATVAAVGILLAGYLQRVRNPTSPHRRPSAAAAASPFLAPSPPPGDSPWVLAGERPLTREQDSVAATGQEPDAGTEAFLMEELAPLPPAASGALAPAMIDPGAPDSAPIAADEGDAVSWRPTDHEAGNGSGNMKLTQSASEWASEPVAPATRGPGSSPPRTDEDDPTS